MAILAFLSRSDALTLKVQGLRGVVLSPSWSTLAHSLSRGNTDAVIFGTPPNGIIEEDAAQSLINQYRGILQRWHHGGAFFAAEAS